MMHRVLSRNSKHLQVLLRSRQLHSLEVSLARRHVNPAAAAAVATSSQWRRSTNHRFFSDKSGDTKGTEETAAPEEEEEEEPTEEGEETTEESTEEPSREQELEKEVRQLKDQLLRSLAEQDNTRRIAQKDVESARNFAIRSFAKSLLDTSDNLSRALDAVPEDMRADPENHPVLATLYEGIQMTETGLNKAFESNGLVQYGEVGEAFDPNKHEALFQYQDPNAEPNTVGQVMKKGFLLNKRVLRSAEVGVVSKSA